MIVGSIWSPILTNAFLAYHEDNWLESFVVEYKQFYYQKFTFALLNSTEHLIKLSQNYLNLNIKMKTTTEYP